MPCIMEKLPPPHHSSIPISMSQITHPICREIGDYHFMEKLGGLRPIGFKTLVGITISPVPYQFPARIVQYAQYNHALVHKTILKFHQFAATQSRFQKPGPHLVPISDQSGLVQSCLVLINTTRPVPYQDSLSFNYFCQVYMYDEDIYTKLFFLYFLVFKGVFKGSLIIEC